MRPVDMCKNIMCRGRLPVCMACLCDRSAGKCLLRLLLLLSPQRVFAVIFCSDRLWRVLFGCRAASVLVLDVLLVRLVLSPPT